MAVNTKKHGYSTMEVGQIIGKNYATVRRMVQKGVIKGSISKTDPNDKRTTVRIPREALVEYLITYRELFDDSLLKAFGVGEEIAPGASLDDLTTPGTYVVREPGKPAIVGKAKVIGKPDPTAELIDDDDCCGVTPVKTLIPSYAIVINGRICIANVQLHTAIDILDLLSKDATFKFNGDVTIRKGI